MFNLSDKELDRLSREAADAYEVEKNASSWDALEQRLDHELGTAPTPNPAVPPPRSFVFPFAYTSIIILLVGSGYFLLKSGKKNNTENKINYTLNNTDKNQQAETSSQKEALTKDIAKGDKNRSADNNASTKNEAKNETVHSGEGNADKEKTDLSTNNSVAANNSEKKNDAAIKTDNSSINKTDAVNNKLTTVNNNKEPHQKNQKNYFNKRRADDPGNITDQETTKSNISSLRLNKVYGSKSKDRDQAIANKILDKSENTNTINEEDFKYAPKQNIELAAKHSNILISDSALLAEATKKHDLIDLNKKSKSLNINKSLQIGLTFAPDFSKVKYVYENYHIGTSVGITLGYQLMHRLSVNTGVLYSNKYYQADGDDFHPQQQPVNAALVNEHIDFVRGSVKIIEVPLNLRYDFSSDGNTTFFVNGGFSSYFLLNQNNSYYCRDYVGYQRWIKQSYDKDENYWLSMFNLSLGFETFVTNNISFQVDPYVKLPLRGIGLGNMQLSSYGIN